MPQFTLTDMARDRAAVAGLRALYSALKDKTGGSDLDALRDLTPAEVARIAHAFLDANATELRRASCQDDARREELTRALDGDEIRNGAA